MPCCCSKQMTGITLCFFRHWFHIAVIFTRKNFQHDSGLWPCPLQDFSFRPHLRVVGFCIRSVVAILPVGLITFVGIRNFNIPGNPGSPDWPSALRLLTSSGFGSVDSSVARFVFLPCAALRRSWGFHIELPCGSCLLCPYMMSIIGSLLQRGLILFYLSGLTARFSAVQRFQLCFVEGISHRITLRLLFAMSLHDEYHWELTVARVNTFLLIRPYSQIFSSSKNSIVFCCQITF
jgi:hypothetical protein